MHVNLQSSKVKSMWWRATHACRPIWSSTFYVPHSLIVSELLDVLCMHVSNNLRRTNTGSLYLYNIHYTYCILISYTTIYIRSHFPTKDEARWGPVRIQLAIYIHTLIMTIKVLDIILCVFYLYLLYVLFEFNNYLLSYILVWLFKRLLKVLLSSFTHFFSFKIMYKAQNMTDILTIN